MRVGEEWRRTLAGGGGGGQLVDGVPVGGG